MSKTFKEDRTTWTPGWIVEDETNHLLICVNENGTVVGTCRTDMQPVVVKRWIVKVGEFKRVAIRNQERFLVIWDERMVDDDNDRYNVQNRKDERAPGQNRTLSSNDTQIQ